MQIVYQIIFILYDKKHYKDRKNGINNENMINF